MEPQFATIRGTAVSRWPRSIDLRSLVSPGDVVAWTHGGAEPMALVGQLLEQASTIGPIDVFLPGLSWSDLELGVVDGSAKEIDANLAVAGELVGSGRLYRFAADNPGLALRRTAYLSSEPVLGRLGSFVSVNGALEVDLSGQVNAESQGGTVVGAIGGQVDFVRGAACSPGGRSIIALPSMTSGGRSRIVSQLESGTVTTPRSEVDLVVTEHGVAELQGRTLSERAAALIAIAHPDHRDALERAFE